MAQYPTSNVSITLADGKERYLRFSLGAVKRIKDKFGKDFTEILAHPPEVLLPTVLMEGLVDKEGLTEQVLLDEMLTGPMIEYVQLCFVESFFGDRQRRTVEALLAKSREALESSLKPAPVPPTDLPPHPPIVN